MKITSPDGKKYNTEEVYNFFKVVQKNKNMCLQWMSFIKGI